MTKFAERIAPVVAQLLPAGGKDFHNIVSANCTLLLSARDGGYLLKTNEHYYPGCDFLYVCYTFTDRGSIPFSNRAQAQWFTREEAVELILRWGQRRIKMVKR